jgi:predicted alpha/beta-hydrolase family hydrolase
MTSPDAADTVPIDVPGAGRVSGLLRCPLDAAALLVLAHGAGAGMRHPFLETVATQLAVRRVATLRYQFPYMEARRRRPDPPRVAEATVRAAVAAGGVRARGMPLFAGGKSYGGRMTTRAQAAAPLDAVRGIVLLGFPLHAARQPVGTRAEHLARVTVPLLFIQGTRDPLAGLDEMRAVCDGLGPRVTLHVVDGGDHSFAVPKADGRGSEAVLGEVAAAVAGWIARVLDRPA